jgi:hypothetical protein
METVRLLLLVVHILGFSALIVGLLVKPGPDPNKVNPAMRDGVGTAFLAGLALVGELEAGDDDVNHAKVALKLGVGLVLLALVMANVRKPSIPQGLFYWMLALSVLNVCVAVVRPLAHT